MLGEKAVHTPIVLFKCNTSQNDMPTDIRYDVEYWYQNFTGEIRHLVTNRNVLLPDHITEDQVPEGLGVQVGLDPYFPFFLNIFHKSECFFQKENLMKN